MRLNALRRYWHTLRYLRPVQVYGRAWFRLYRPKPNLAPAPGVRVVSGRWEPPARRRPSLVGPETFIFLRKSGSLSEIGWNGSQRERLWRYNQHYFDDLNAQGNESRTDWHRRLLLSWVTGNPPGHGVGWEPYPTSVRIVNWIKWALAGHVLPAECVSSLAIQARWLSERLEFHLLGNHLLANAKALVFCGLYFQGDEAEQWLRRGIRLLQRELPEQVLPDGGHCERSPMYHLIVLEDLLDLINICRAYDQAIPGDWLTKVRQMLRWAAVMRHPDGELAFFNDAAFGVACRFDALQAYAARLGIDGPWDSEGGVWLEPSGYLRLANRDAVLFFDVAPLGPDHLPGHAHADTLSLELSLFGQRVLVNSGTSLYGTGPERQRQRGTGAHNTVMVDDQDSSEVWGGFRVARRARVQNVVCIPEDGVAEAEHDGYCRLPGRPVHQRRVRLTEGVLTVTDIVSGACRHRVKGAWHLHPDVVLAHNATTPETALLLKVPVGTQTREVALTVQGPVALAVEECTWHPEFGRSVPNRRLVFRYHGPLPVTVTTRLCWRR